MQNRPLRSDLQNNLMNAKVRIYIALKEAYEKCINAISKINNTHEKTAIKEEFQKFCGIDLSQKQDLDDLFLKYLGYPISEILNLTTNILAEIKKNDPDITNQDIYLYENLLYLTFNLDSHYIENAFPPILTVSKQSAFVCKYSSSTCKNIASISEDLANKEKDKDLATLASIKDIYSFSAELGNNIDTLISKLTNYIHDRNSKTNKNSSFNVIDIKSHLIKAAAEKISVARKEYLSSIFNAELIQARNLKDKSLNQSTENITANKIKYAINHEIGLHYLENSDESVLYSYLKLLSEIHYLIDNIQANNSVITNYHDKAKQLGLDTFFKSYSDEKRGKIIESLQDLIAEVSEVNQKNSVKIKNNKASHHSIFEIELLVEKDTLDSENQSADSAEEESSSTKSKELELQNQINKLLQENETLSRENSHYKERKSFYKNKTISLFNENNNLNYQILTRKKIENAIDGFDKFCNAFTNQSTNNIFYFTVFNDDKSQVENFKNSFDKIMRNFLKSKNDDELSLIQLKKRFIQLLQEYENSDLLPKGFGPYNFKTYLLAYHDYLNAMVRSKDVKNSKVDTITNIVEEYHQKYVEDKNINIAETYKFTFQYVYMNHEDKSIPHNLLTRKSNF